MKINVPLLIFFLILFVILFFLSVTLSVFLLFFKKRNDVNKIFDKKKFYEEIFQTVKYCSLQKIGLIIAFEKKDDLTKKISHDNNGVIIDSILSNELLTTIFYPNTKLHDGAVIIRKNRIFMANVMFNNKIKKSNSFYLSLGSRHRAAIAISEISDSIILVVSEQTGKINIFKDGLMNPIQINKFINIFSSYMEN